MLYQGVTIHQSDLRVLSDGQVDLKITFIKLTRQVWTFILEMKISAKKRNCLFCKVRLTNHSRCKSFETFTSSSYIFDHYTNTLIFKLIKIFRNFIQLFLKFFFSFRLKILFKFNFSFRFNNFISSLFLKFGFKNIL